MIKKIPVGHVDQCQICSEKNLETILSFGHQPIVQNYLTAEQLNQPEITYPLNFCYCSNCGLAQLDYIIDQKLVFPLNYPYRTGLTNMLIKNFRSLADTLEKKYLLTTDDLIIDIGSNDGSLLKPLKDKGMKVLGIEPTNAAEDANNQGIRTIQGYFNEKIANQAVKKYGKAKIITMTNAFAHINNLFEILKGIEIMLDDDGIFVSESQYLLDMMQGLELDTIYHEHLRFYSLKPLIRLFSLTGFSLIDAETIPAAGGSIRVYAKKGQHLAGNNLKKMIKAEEAIGLYDIKKLKKYGHRMIEAKKELMALLINCQRQGARIAAIGSPARSNTLLGFTHIDNHLIDYAGEKSGSPKIGLFTPGTHIPVVDEKKLFVDQPDYALVLSWHLGKELMQLMRKLGFKGKFIMPLPQPRVVEEI
ncbi:MAG: class I SAM-dependent methyltransferase [bacterium]|nr:class I SAM-dependent methyltransferase [bacterium]